MHASKGEGLGKQFLATIRTVDPLIHVMRYFSSPEFIHVLSKVDPLADIETIDTGLILADFTLRNSTRKLNEQVIQN
jgi:ribosome-binding ATPase